MDMQKRTNADIPPHHIIIQIEVPEDLRAHDAIARIDVAEVAQRDHGEIPLGDARLARDDGAQDGEPGQQHVHVAERVGEDEGAAWGWG